MGALVELQPANILRLDPLRSRESDGISILLHFTHAETQQLVCLEGK